MIEFLRVQNFQSHKNAELELHPGVNVLVGRSDMGKSALLRALVWGIYGYPTGDAFMSSWGGDTLVEVGFDDCALTRSKGKDTYYDLDGKIFRAFGTSVPEPIVEILRMNEINAQAQLDAPFLLSASAPEVARLLNRAVRLDDIDVAQQNISRTVREVSSRVKFLQESKEDLTKELRTFSYLTDIEARVDATESLAQYVDELRERRASLSRAVQKVKEAQIAKHAAPKISIDIDALETRAQRVQLLKNKQQQIKDTLIEIRQLQETQEQTQQVIKELEKEMHKLMPHGSRCPLCGQVIKCEDDHAGVL